MKDCYSCGKEMQEGEGQAFDEYGPPGEHLICMECASSCEPCYVCRVLCDPGSNESGQCDICQRFFHIGCDRGWHSNPDDFNCSECGRKRGLDTW